jgi:6-phosphogluconolactonase (cycloisomerase 2 family)
MSGRKLISILYSLVLVLSAAAAFAGAPFDHDSGKEDRAVGAVYVMTNAPDANEIVVFDRDEEGLLTKAGSIATGGAGSGGGVDALVSQGSLVLSEDGRWLLAVNAGSGEISVFRVRPHKLVLTDKVGSGGGFPVSLTIHHDLVYVLNAGATPNITGFTLSRRGELTALDNSTRYLGPGGYSQCGFDPDGNVLVVTGRSNNEILVYTVGRRGLPSWDPVRSPSSGIAPFGFIFDERGHLLVVEAGTNAVSSYSILRNGTLQVISASVANGQVAACWIAGNGRGYVFTTNPGTSSISSYVLKRGRGGLMLLNGVAGSGSAPLDLSLAEGRFLYAIDPGNGSVDMFRIERDGSLSVLGAAAEGFAAYAQGIAAR